MLFNHLPDELFSPLTGKNRYLHAAVINEIYDEFFGSGALLTPVREEMVRLIYDIITRHADLWHEEDEGALTFEDLVPSGRRLKRRGRRKNSDTTDGTDEAQTRARTVYVRLVKSGWLEEVQYGLKITVDMPTGSMMLAQFLSDLKQDIRANFAGLVNQVSQAVRSSIHDPRKSGPGLNKAAQNSHSFMQRLRAILSALKDIERRILDADSDRTRIETLMEDFLGDLLLRDFKTLHTRSHPAAHKVDILDGLRTIRGDESKLQSLTESYLGIISEDRDDCRSIIENDLERIRSSFLNIDAIFEAISQKRINLERKLRNTVRYATYSSDRFGREVIPLITALDRFLEQKGDARSIPSLLGSADRPLSVELHAKPKAPRAPIEDDLIIVRERDPIFSHRIRMKREFETRVNVSSNQVMRFLEQNIPPEFTTTAQDIPIQTLDAALSLLAIRTALNGGNDVMRRRLEVHFNFSKAPDDRHRLENEYFACANFRIHRKDDHVTNL